MSILEPWDQLEEKEEVLRQRIQALPEAQRKEYYKRQLKSLKDPDTYASLNWFFLGGIHHLYLGKYVLFAIEFTLLIISGIFWLAGYPWALLVLLLLALYEIPQLFFSQKIARQYNYKVSLAIYNELTPVSRTL